MPIVPAYQKLTVEADFHFKPGMVAIRLYVQDNASGDREFLTLGALCNCVADLRRPAGQRLNLWERGDEEFLRFLGRTVVPKFSPKHYKLGLFTVGEERFQQWRRQFSDQPGRFVNRSDQRPIPPPGQTAAVAECFVLSERGVPPGFFRLEAYILFPDGTRATAHELLRSLGGDPNQAVTRTELFRTRLPVPWEQLARHFNCPVTKIPKARAAEMLPPLVCNRLELLEGPVVERQMLSGFSVPAIHFSCQEHQFQVCGRLAGRTMRLNARDGGAVVRLHVNSAGRLVLGEQPSSPAAEKALSVLQELARQPRASVSSDVVTFPEDAQSAEFLAAVWRNLPDELEKSCVPELQGLLASDGRAAELQPCLSVARLGALVEVRVEWHAGAQVITAERLAQGLRLQSRVLQDGNGHWLTLDPATAAAARERLHAAGLLDGEEESAVMLRSDAARTLRRLSREMPFALADQTSRNFADALQREPPPALPKVPEIASKLLRPYQLRGFEFLADRTACGVGSLLADDMGLGKTLQVLALLQSFRAQATTSFQALVVCPGSVMGVWIAQASEFFPELPVLALSGPPEHRQKLLEKHCRDAVFVTHYGLLRADAKLHQSRRYDFLVADEAQFLKNPDALATLTIKSLDAKHKIALTGTPLENRLLDLWSVMDFLNPGYLGGRELFQSGMVNPAALARRLAPLMLRRTKQSVASELPPRTVMVLPVSLGEEQRALYEEEVVRARAAIQNAGPVQILSALTRLRELCCDPELLLRRPHGHGSAKLELLLSQCEELLTSGHSVLVFSQFASMLHIIARNLADQGLPHHVITGETPLEARARIVRQFQEDSAPEVLLLSLKAAGTGLTLTRADYVFLYDPWWNPAAEDQAIDRTHRIGQARPVFAYRLVARGTVEERVLELMAAKRELFAQVVEAAAGQAVPARLSREDLAGLLG